MDLPTDKKLESNGKTSSKRKRDLDGAANDELEIEIDINAPEPPSKKAKRKEKKAKKGSSNARASAVEDSANASNDQDAPTTESSAPAPLAHKKKERGEHGVWIGNLSFTTTKDDVRSFLRDQGQIAETQVTRVHMPASSDGKAKNKGFAYVDLATAVAFEKALSLSEKLLGGRKLLIKNAKSFEGRPEKPLEKVEADKGKEATKRIFVGNLGFDVTREELAEHFAQAGEVDDVFLATFEDSGKCKGFGWVRFKDVEAAKAAVKGFAVIQDETDGDSEEEGEASMVTEKGGKKKKSKGKKVFVNRFNGRPLRCEFAEDAQTRYKKRYGKDKDAKPSKPQAVRQDDAAAGAEANGDHRASQKPKPKRKGTADERREDRRKRHDARTIAPGQALSHAPRASAAIVAGSGKKISFD